MSLGQAIAPHLPYLRRYGRAISGSQQRGDALVARILETLVATCVFSSIAWFTIISP